MRFDQQFTKSLLVHGTAAFKANELRSAQRYLERVIRLPSTPYQRQKALYLLSEISDDNAEIRGYLEEILISNPGHHVARRKLAIVDGRIDTENIVDPDKYEQEIYETPQEVKGEIFVCPNCAGRMVYTPDGNNLFCEYCTYAPQIQKNGNPIEEQDFIIGMATAKGHSRAISTKSFQCQSCGVAYLLNPEIISTTCPHCESTYSIADVQEKKLIPPTAIIPFSITREIAENTIINILRSRIKDSKIRFSNLQGIYIPVWTFDIRGDVPFSYSNGQTSRSATGSKYVFFDDILIPGNQNVPIDFHKILAEYNTKRLKTFKTGYLSNWLAETYQITLSDAALLAREQAVLQTKQLINSDPIFSDRELVISSSHLFIDTYKLILIPIWIGNLLVDSEKHQEVIPG